MTDINDSIKNEMLALREDFVEHLRAELVQLHQQAGQLSVGTDKKKVLEQLHQRLHQLSGSSGTFGFKKLGAQARELDMQVQEWLKDAKIVDSEKYTNFAANILSMEKALSYDCDMIMEIEAAQNIDDGNNISSEEMQKILVVDDDKNICELISTALKERYLVAVASTGEEALLSYQRDNPDIILLDIDLPDMDGYEVCSRIKELDPAGLCSIIFVSAHDTLQDRVIAFDCGGHDFIAKPFSLGEFSTKIKSLAAYTRSKKHLISQNQFAQSMVFEVMAESAQYGHLVNFLSKAMKCESIEELAHLFFEVSKKFNLNVSLCLRGNEVIYSCPNQQPCSPIEINLFEIMYKMGRLYHFGSRTMVNDEHVSFLVKNMPVEDDKEYGRLKDIIAVLSEAMESSFLSICRKQSLSDAIIRVDTIQERLIGAFLPDSDVTQSLNRLRGLMSELEDGFHYLDLTEEQENMLYGLLEKGGKDAGTVLEIMEAMRGDMVRLAEALRIGVV